MASIGAPPEPASVESGGAAPKPSIVRHYLHYSTANVLTIVASFVSFPVLTRLLDNTQYGILGYYDTLVAIAVAVAKLGSQHAVLRFYPSTGDARDREHFATNLLAIPFLLSLALWLALSLASWLGGWFSGNGLSLVFWVTVALVPFSMFGKIADIVLMASERSGLLMMTRVAGRWMEVALVLSAVILLQHSALAVFGGKLVATILLAMFYLHWMTRHLRISRSAVDLSTTRIGLFYGVPLMGNELASLALGAIDRIMLKELTGDFAAVGIYTIGYALAMQISVFMSATLSDAFVPVANRVHGGEGDEAVRALKRRLLLPMTYASVGIAAMVLGVGQEALVALSGPTKAASGIVFVIIGMTMALFPLIDISSYGLLLHKRSMMVFSITLVGAATNIGLNFLLIPRMGLMGAVWTTVISFSVLGVLRAATCPRGLLCFPQWRPLLTATSSAVLLVSVIKSSDLLGVEHVWLRLFVAGVMFLLLYALPVWLLDSSFRAAVQSWRKGAGT